MMKWTRSALSAMALFVAASASDAQQLANEGREVTGGAIDSLHARQQTPSAWYERIRLRGYTQLRYNRLLETNRDLVCPQCDRSIGDRGGFFIRRGRLVISGDVSDRLSIYIQPDFATDAAGGQYYLQLRDAYFDVYLDKEKSHRFRMGLSKVPFGFENLQSSSNRLPLDRADGLNSAIPGERDIGVLYYWTTASARRLFKVLTDSGLKGTGDYGVLGVGLVNGQTANRAELNNSLHQVVRLTHPFELPGGQYVEIGVQAFDGNFVLPTRTTGVTAASEYDDRRVGVSFTWYAQPIGFVGEWNWGEGPEYEAASRSVEMRHPQGGFAQTMYRARTGKQVIQPFARAQYYRGGRKTDLDARSHVVREYDAGIEWLPMSALELTAQYSISDRQTMDGALTTPNRQKGRLLRLQAQFNY
jgi:hypothetical protein